MAGGSGITRRAFLAGAVAAAWGAALPAQAASCPPTEENVLGPFYLPGSPFRERLAPDDEPGDRLLITGRVLSAAGCAPLAGAVVDVWHANSAGAYYGLEAGDAARAEGWRLRGRANTGADGRYRFETVVPGSYPVGPRQRRPGHVHFLVAHAAHRALTTQLYFAGDPLLATDELVRRSLVFPLAEAGADAGGRRRYAVSFDVVLAPL